MKPDDAVPDALEQRLQACLDERRDPFADDELCALLAADPARLDAVAELCARLRVLPAAAARPQHRWPLLAAIGGIAAAAALAIALGWPTATAPQARILAVRFTTTTAPARLTAAVTASQLLVATPTTRLESYTRWSPRR